LVWAIDNLNGTQQIQQYDISNSVVSTLVDLKSFRPLEIKGITLDTDNTRAHLVMISGTSSFIVSANTSSGAVLNKTLLSNDYSNLMDLQYDKKQKVLFAFIQQNRFIPTLHYIAVGIIDLVTGSFHSLTKIQTHFNLFLSSTYNTDTGEYFFIMASTEDEWNLFKFNTNTQTLQQVVAEYGWSSIAFNRANSSILGLQWHQPIGSNQLVQFDPSTGVTTAFGKPFANRYCGAFTIHGAIDASNRYYYTMCCSDTLCYEKRWLSKINTSTNMVISDVVIQDRIVFGLLSI